MQALTGRRIEVVITRLTRNMVGFVTTYFPKLRETSAFSPISFASSETRFSQFSRNLVNRLLPLQFHMETYRSGHNGTDSKSYFFGTLCIQNLIWKRIEVVITGLTRNQVVLTGSWVRIPPLPPSETRINAEFMWVFPISMSKSQRTKNMRFCYFYGMLSRKL